MVLKENETCVILDPVGGANSTAAGIYRRDTRYLSNFEWKITTTDATATSQVLQCDVFEDKLTAHLAIKNGITALGLLIRNLTVCANGLRDSWQLTNLSQQTLTITLTLSLVGDGCDLFAVFNERAREQSKSGMTCLYEGSTQTLTLERTAQDGVIVGAEVSPVPENLVWVITLAPAETKRIVLNVALFATDDSATSPLPSYAEWRRKITNAPMQRHDQAALNQAIDDIRMLLFQTDHGLYPAAGAPHFVTVFGRDALITAMMLLPTWPEVAEGTLRFLAHHQGKHTNPFHEEEPGKILHEMRRGELSRRGIVPFGKYYGSVDATPLFLMALDAHYQHTGKSTLIEALKPAWELAATWLTSHQNPSTGLIAFKPSGSGLLVQSWKDSSESMVHADGSLAIPPLAVAEVQGYAYAAFLALANFYAISGETEKVAQYRARAELLAGTFNDLFWIDDMSTYAMAIDGNQQPLRVLSSDPGHLLWVGIVPTDRAKRLVNTLMSPSLWSGWGLRTLGADEKSFNPLSYHNGSVWPHDTALFAAGLARYGFNEELAIVERALFDLAQSQPDFRLPELISGIQRQAGLGPVQYTHACRPQAWAAAALPFLVHLKQYAK
jgi:glycogen debranching enzyme